MGLTNLERGILNRQIDYTVGDIQPIVEFARIPELRSMCNDKDGFDFSLGSAITEIHLAFVMGFKARNQRPINKEEKNEIFNILGRRIHEIKEAINKMG